MLAILTITTKVDVNHSLVFKAIKQVFADGLAAFKNLSRDLPGIRAKASLRAGHLEWLTREPITVLSGKIVGLVSFGHAFFWRKAVAGGPGLQQLGVRCAVTGQLDRPTTEVGREIYDVRGAIRTLRIVEGVLPRIKSSVARNVPRQAYLSSSSLRNPS